MEMQERVLRRRRAVGGGIAGVTVGAVILASALVPTAANALDTANPNDPAVAQGQIIQLPAALLGGLDIAALGHTLTSNPAAPGSELGGLDVGLLEALNIDVGTLNVPLLTDGTGPGLLRLGDLGAAQSFSSSPTQTQSIASSGTITTGGAIDTGAIDGGVNPGTLELTDLFDQLAVAGLTDAVLDQASVGIGALASRAESNAAAATSQYRIADLNLDLHSNLVAGLSGTLASAIQGTVTPVSDLAGPGGALTALVTTLVSTINAIPDVPLLAAFTATGGTVGIAGLDTVGQTVTTQVLETPIENTTGSVLVDLSTGTVSVDLAKILVETGAGANLNTLPANTPVLSATTISAIQQGVTSALTGTHPNSLNGKVSTILKSTLDALQVTLTVGVDLTVPLTGTALVSGDVTVKGSLAQFAGTAAPVPTVTTDITLAGLNIGVLLDPVVSAVTNAVATTTGPLVNTALNSVIPLAQPALAALTGPVLTTLDPVLQGVLSDLVDITINEQPATGDIPGDSFTVRALAVDLLPAVGGGVSLDLGSSTVKSAAAAVAAIDAAATVQAGTDLAVTGSGWPANTEVTVQVTAPGGGAVGTGVPITTDGGGAFTLSYPIPAGAAPGVGYIVTATDGTSTATDTTEVTAAAAVDAAPAVQAGTNLGISGTNWPANTQVSVQLQAPGGGANIGGPEVVTTDAAGTFTLDYPVPAGTPAATGYEVTATAGTQTATDTTEVTDAPVAAIDAAATVQAGTSLPVTGSNWPANTEVSVQLTAPGGGADIGGPETVTTDGSGAFTLDYPVPASATPGTGYTVTATVGAQTATDTTEVTAAVAIDAAATVQAGTTLPVTGSNWPANTEVSVQLTAPGGGADIGGPETVTTDGSGAFTLDYPVPASATPGAAYTVTATAGAVTAIDTTEVTAAVAIDAAATVQAGTTLPVTGSNWPANTEVSVQLTAPGGGADIGGPETVTTDGSGAFTLDYPVPASATPGTGYTVTATVGAQTATDTTEVTDAATVDAAATVQAGSDLVVSGTNWPADTDVIVQLSAPGGGAIGTPQTVTTGGLGAFTLDYPVPAGTPAGTGYTVTASAGAQTATDTTEVTAAPVVVDAAATVAAGTNLAVTGTGWPVSTSVSLQLTAPGGGADVGGPVTVTTDASGAFAANYPVPIDTTPGTGYTLTATAGAVTGSDTTEVTAGDPGDVNTNAAASASASADATADGDPSAQAAAEAAALADATSTASAAATADATSAAESAATTTASTTASTDATSTANAAAAVAAQAAAQADASSDVNAAASTAADSNSAASSESAATATSSADASSEAAANANAAASASASANADASTAAVAEASAQAAAFSDATAEGSAAADPAAEAASEAAATATSSTAATADATSEANAGAAIAAQAAALADATTDTAAEASATDDASTSAAANASAAAIASASTDASSDAVGSADASAEINTNASASASASAQADDDSNASVEAAAVAAALADATSQASAAADVSASAAAQAAATTDASTDASTTATTAANASAAAAAQAAAQNDATSTSEADASASADADPNASAAAAANASSSATASASAAADSSAEATAAASATASATATASSSADAAADPTGNIAITIKSPVLERGKQQTAVGTGFTPGETVTGVMTSDPLALGSQVANAQGTVTFTWTVPTATDLGTHTVTLTGATSGSVSATFQLVASGLATTGGQLQSGWIALAALLLTLGLGTMRLARSRRPLVQTE